MNFASSNEGKWFDFDANDPSKGGVQIRVLSLDETKRIDKLAVKTRMKPMRGQMVKIEDVNEELQDRLRWDYCIVDWKDVTLDGKPLPCTTENKVALMKNVRFINFLVDKINELTEELEISSEDSEKNSETSSSGSAQPIA